MHGWLLMAWAGGVGLATSAVMLHLFQVHSMAIRYAVGAGTVYFLGFVWGGWWYAKWWNTQRHVATELPQHASVDDQVAYQEQEEAIRKKFSWFDGLGNLGGDWGDDPLSAIIGIFVVLCAALFLLLLLGYLPFMLTDLLAGYLAEIVLEFVIGGVLIRRILRPRALDDYWRFIVGKTWLFGLLMMLAFGAVGYTVQSVNPQAHTLLQAFR